MYQVSAELRPDVIFGEISQYQNIVAKYSRSSACFLERGVPIKVPAQVVPRKIHRAHIKKVSWRKVPLSRKRATFPYNDALSP